MAEVKSFVKLPGNKSFAVEKPDAVEVTGTPGFSRNQLHLFFKMLHSVGLKGRNMLAQGRAFSAALGRLV